MIDTANLQERFTKEIEQLRDELRELKGEQQLPYERRRFLQDIDLSPKQVFTKSNADVKANNISDIDGNRKDDVGEVRTKKLNNTDIIINNRFS